MAVAGTRRICSFKLQHFSGESSSLSSRKTLFRGNALASCSKVHGGGSVDSDDEFRMSVYCTLERVFRPGSVPQPPADQRTTKTKANNAARRKRKARCILRQDKLLLCRKSFHAYVFPPSVLLKCVTIFQTAVRRAVNNPSLPSGELMPSSLR